MLIPAVLFIGIFGLAAMVIAATMLSRGQDKPPEGSDTWPMTEGTVRGSGMAAVSRYSQLPWFDFSYVVNDEYYSGTFFLAAEGDRADTLLREMDDKKFEVRYDPDRPSEFYIAEETIGGCEVKFRSRASLTS